MEKFLEAEDAKATKLAKTKKVPGEIHERERAEGFTVFHSRTAFQGKTTSNWKVPAKKQAIKSGKGGGFILKRTKYGPTNIK